MRLDFLGATEEVTGSKFLLTTKDGIKILLDCGMYQGKGLETDAMNRDLGFDPTKIDIVTARRSPPAIFPASSANSPPAAPSALEADAAGADSMI